MSCYKLVHCNQRVPIQLKISLLTKTKKNRVLNDTLKNYIFYVPTSQYATQFFFFSPVHFLLINWNEKVYKLSSRNEIKTITGHSDKMHTVEFLAIFWRVRDIRKPNFLFLLPELPILRIVHGEVCSAERGDDCGFAVQIRCGKTNRQKNIGNKATRENVHFLGYFAK